MKPVVSIIVPIYNSSLYLRECLDSIVSQSFDNWECILVNDGSTDDSQSIIDEYCAKDSRFIPVQKENEQSIDKARRYGIKYANTDWLLQIDSDDAIEPNLVEKLISRQHTSKAEIVTCCMIGCVKELEGVAYSVPGKDFDYRRVVTGREACLMTLGNWQIPGQGNLYHKRLLDAVPEGGIGNADELTSRYIFFNASKVAFTDALYYYRSNDGTSAQVSFRMFNRAKVDKDIEGFGYNYYPNQTDVLKKLIHNRLFNLIYLCADAQINDRVFTKEQNQQIKKILLDSYHTLRRREIVKYLPSHAWMTLLPYSLFKRLAYRYVTYKRSHGGNYFYR